MTQPSLEIINSIKSEALLSPPTKFVQEPSSHLKCPVCGNVYQDPVINVKCGHTFCQRCASTSQTCPVDDSPCDADLLVLNRLVVGQIDDLKIYCQHGLVFKDDELQQLPGLCTQVINFSKRKEHEDSCLFAPQVCPNSEQCGSIRKRDVDRHISECVRTPCKHKKSGCTYRGTPNQIKDHSKICPFRESVQGNGLLTHKLDTQDAQIETLQQENAKLSNKVTEMEKSQNQMAAQIEKQTAVIQTLSQKLDTLSKRFDHWTTNQIRRPVSIGSQLSLMDGVSGTASTTSHIGGSSSVAYFRQMSPGRNQEKWEMPFQFKCMGTYRGHKDVVWSMTTKKGRLFSGSADGIIKVWSLEQLAKGCMDTINAHKGVIHCLSSSGNTLISAGDDMNISLWDLGTYQRKTQIQGAHDNTICAMVVSEDLLFSSSFSVIKAWDLKSLEMKATFGGTSHWVRALALGLDKDKLYSGSHNAVHIWDIKDGFNKLATLEHRCGSVYSLAVNNAYIVVGNSGSYDQNIQLYNCETLDFVTNLCGHIGTVTTLIISTSGRFMFSASQDSNIQVWSLEKLLPIQTLSRHQGSVNTLTLHGDFLLSGSEDHEIKVFRYFQIQ